MSPVLSVGQSSVADVSVSGKIASRQSTRLAVVEDEEGGWMSKESEGVSEMV